MTDNETRLAEYVAIAIVSLPNSGGVTYVEAKEIGLKVARAFLADVPDDRLRADPEMWWRCRCHDVVLNDCPNRDKILTALASPKGDGHRYDHDGTARHHHDSVTGNPIWWVYAEQFGGERREHPRFASSKGDGLEPITLRDGQK